MNQWMLFLKTILLQSWTSRMKNKMDPGMFTEEREQGVRKDWSTLLNTAEKRTGFYNCWGLDFKADLWKEHEESREPRIGQQSLRRWWWPEMVERVEMEVRVSQQGSGGNAWGKRRGRQSGLDSQVVVLSGLGSPAGGAGFSGRAPVTLIHCQVRWLWAAS